MGSSYRSIDYRIRPAKYAERQMLCEAFQRLQFHSLEEYQYVGLGSVFFSDFQLLHRRLGISRMFSIEKNESDGARFEWNKPYKGITMLFGRTEQRLADIDFSVPTITWLDYDGPMVESVLSDIRTVSHSASHGSVLVVTVNAHQSVVDPSGEELLPRVRATLGDNRIPTDTTEDTLYSWGLARLYRAIGDREIRDALSIANGVRQRGRKLGYEQLFNFEYRDGARMVTFGGVFVSEAKRDEMERCSFGRLTFFRGDCESFSIAAPNLTQRETAYLERQLPLADESEVERGSIPEKDARNYIALYRYLPTFVPIDVM